MSNWLARDPGNEPNWYAIYWHSFSINLNDNFSNFYSIAINSEIGLGGFHEIALLKFKILRGHILLILYRLYNIYNSFPNIYTQIHIYI